MALIIHLGRMSKIQPDFESDKVFRMSKDAFKKLPRIVIANKLNLRTWEFPIIQLLTMIFASILLSSLSSCSEMGFESENPNLIPTEELPTVIAMTVEEIIAKEESVIKESNQTTPEPSPTITMEILPSVTPTPISESFRIVTATKQSLVTVTPMNSSNIPFADIQFLSPGELSRVTSPINLHAFMIPGDSGRAKIELFGEDGRLMYRKLFMFTSPPGLQANLRTEIDFEIAGVAETARLVISTDDSYGRMKSAASLTLILLSLGDSDINPAGDQLSPIVIQEPKPKVLIQGENLKVSGLIRTDSDQPLLVEIVTTDGKVIGSRLAGIVSGRTGNYREFATELSFSVDTPTWVRVMVSKRNNGNTTPLELSSLELLLSP